MSKIRGLVITELKPYFNVSELVCDHTFRRFGEASWQFFPTFALENMLVLRRDIICAPMVCNTKDLHQRGLRCNICPIVKDKDVNYLSPHCLGLGWDFTVLGMTAEQARNRIREDQMRLPYPARIEQDVRWLHFDCLQQYGIDVQLYEFVDNQ